MGMEREQRLTVSAEMAGAAVVGLAFLAAIGVRWLHLDGVSLWWDEGFTLWGASIAAGHIIPFAKSDNQAPLYYLIQHYWDLIFGNSEFALRALSAFFGTLSLPVFYVLAKRVLKESLAVALSACLFAFSMKQIWYSREARAYETASFFALLALYALIRFLEERSRLWFAVIIVTSAITLYMHNMMFLYLCSLNLTWMIYPSERPFWQRVRELLLADVLTGVLILPWIFTLLAQAAAVTGNLYWVTKPTLQTLLATLRDMAGFDTEYMQIFVARRLPLPTTIVEFGIIGAVVSLSLAFIMGGLWRVSQVDRRKCAAFLAYGLFPIISIFLLSQGPFRLYLDRVFTASSIVVPLLFALPLAAHWNDSSRRWWICGGIVLVAMAALSALGFLRYRETLAKDGENWRGVSAALHTNPETDRLIVFAPPGGQIFYDYYAEFFPSAGPSVTTTGVPRGFNDQFPPTKAKVVDQADIERLKAVVEAKKYSEIDLVLTHDVDANGLLTSYLGGRFVRQEELPPSGPKIRIIPFRALSANFDSRTGRSAGNR